MDIVKEIGSREDDIIVYVAHVWVPYQYLLLFCSQ